PSIWQHQRCRRYVQSHAFEVVVRVITALRGGAASACGGVRWPKRRLETRQRVMRLVPAASVAAFGAVLCVWPFWNMSMFDVADILIHGALPMLALVLISAAGTILLMQTSMLEVMGEDFILTAKAKGLSERIVRKRHAARNAYLPVVTSLAITLGLLVGG